VEPMHGLVKMFLGRAIAIAPTLRFALLILWRKREF
jgi:hypothetical protein